MDTAELVARQFCTVLHALAGIAMATTTKSSTMTHDDETATATEENKLLVGARLLLHCCTDQ